MKKDLLSYVLLVVICVGLIVSGVYCGTLWYQKAHAQSYINGSIDFGDQFHAESFKYIGERVTFHNETNNYYYFNEKNLPAINDFDGEQNKYEFYFNDYLIFDVSYTAGTSKAKIELDFHDSDADTICQAVLNIEIRFLSNRSELTLWTTSAESSAFLEQYFDDFNCRIQINEIKGEKK